MKIDKSRIIQVEEEKELRAVTLGITLLRHVIIALGRRPEFFAPEILDRFLLASEALPPVD